MCVFVYCACLLETDQSLFNDFSSNVGVIYVAEYSSASLERVAWLQPDREILQCATLQTEVFDFYVFIFVLFILLFLLSIYIHVCMYVYVCVCVCMCVCVCVVVVAVGGDLNLSLLRALQVSCMWRAHCIVIGFLWSAIHSYVMIYIGPSDQLTLCSSYMVET